MNGMIAHWWYAKNLIAGLLVIDLFSSEVAEGGARPAIEKTIATVIDSMLEAGGGDDEKGDGR